MPEPVAYGVSIGESLDRAAARLGQAGILNARREATALWAAIAGESPGDVWLRRDSVPTEPQIERFWKAVGRRSSGFPFPYAVGRASFRTLDLKIDQRALIPRPETEGLVGLVLEWGKREERRGTGGIVADVGTGSGCIALALAVEGQFEGVVAVERSPDAAALARENVARIEPPVPVAVRVGDLLAPLMMDGTRYRAIVSNPPYLTEAEYDALEPAVRDFEPREALVSGPDGLAATRALFADAAALLEPDGVLAIEIDERRAPQTHDLAREYGWRRIAIHQDLFNRPRYALAFPRRENA